MSHRSYSFSKFHVINDFRRISTKSAVIENSITFSVNNFEYHRDEVIILI